MSQKYLKFIENLNFSVWEKHKQDLLYENKKKTKIWAII